MTRGKNGFVVKKKHKGKGNNLEKGICGWRSAGLWLTGGGAGRGWGQRFAEMKWCGKKQLQEIRDTERCPGCRGLVSKGETRTKEKKDRPRMRGGGGGGDNNTGYGQGDTNTLRGATGGEAVSSPEEQLARKERGREDFG